MTDMPVAPASFARAMAAFGPFESQPAIAVGVSGGPDSLALAVLLDVWVRPRGGSVLALTVDHGLRPEAAAEARQVSAWMAARGIDHRILSWSGDKPGTGIQAAARQARYGLLAQACADRGVLHLAIGHHADDQAETILFRQERGSGPDGLAGMTACRSLGPVRLIRPLLAWSKVELVRTCAEFSQPFIEDPSNRSSDYARPVLRQRLAGDAAARAALLKTASNAGETRVQLGKTVASILGRIASIGPDGVGFFDRAALADTPPDLRRAALSAMLRTVGGGRFAPDDKAVETLDTALKTAAFRGISLAGCLVRPWRNRLMICREASRCAPPVTLAQGLWRRWDDRFDLCSRTNAALTVAALGQAGYATVRKAGKTALPAAAGAGLPAVRRGDEIVAVPAIGWSLAGTPIVAQRLSPLWPLASETFTVVSAGADIMSDRGERSRLW